MIINFTRPPFLLAKRVIFILVVAHFYSYPLLSTLDYSPCSQGKHDGVERAYAVLTENDDTTQTVKWKKMYTQRYVRSHERNAERMIGIYDA